MGVLECKILLISRRFAQDFPGLLRNQSCRTGGLMFTMKRQEDIHASLQRLAPVLARASAETAGAFFCAESSLPQGRPSPRFSDLGAMRCSQKNVGDNYEMVCNLAVDKAEWDR